MARSSPSPRTSAAQVAGYTSVINSINNGTSSIDVALSAGQSISDLLIQMKQQALSASDTSLDTASRQALNANFTALLRPDHHDRDQRDLQRLQPGQWFDQPDQALASADGSRRITTLAQNMSLSGSIVTMKSTASISTQAKASTLVATIQTSLTNVNSALGQIVGRCGEVLDPGDLRPEAVRYADDRHRQSGGRQHGAGKRHVAVPAGQAAAWHSGSVDRQSGAADASCLCSRAAKA